MGENVKFKGKVVWFSKQKGIGFIEGDEAAKKANNGKDYFVHFSNIQMNGFKTLKAGQTVEFEIGQNHKGTQGVNVIALDEEQNSA